ncbi:MAG TPA: hypothetical protein VMU15_17590 [Anaeromyxobacter sp.]|nr:hypothetical protein [Anaeromyxobacter sp.]
MPGFVLNVVHRPEMVPEYAEKVTGHGKAEDLGRKALLTESLDIFRLQQEIAHQNGLKTTIQMTYASLFSDEAVAIALDHRARHGDEIGLTLLGLPCQEFRERYRTKDFCIWMFSMEDKRSIVTDVFEKFHQRFGFYPQSTGSYYMDAELIALVKEHYPSVKCAVATCWEEGPKAYHTTNNSWYTLMDGGPWNPWIPSRQNTHAPAALPEEDMGVVAIPHLSRDLLACYDGNGSNFGTHPQNVLRGMIYRDGQFPYLFNLVDQYRHLAKYNRGFAYNMMFVGPGWMNKMGRWEAPYELLVKSYREGMAYYGQLKREGELTDMTLSELADHYRATHRYTQPECALWRDILYGSEKQLFWYCDPFLRACVNMDQGGAVVDLRPYVAKLRRPVGIGTGNVHDASYPFLVQEKYRAGYFTHYAGEGTIRSAKVCYRGEEVDLCLCRTKARFSEEGDTRVLTLDPVELELPGLTLKLRTRLLFEEGSAAIRFERQVLEMSDPSAEVELTEYLVACHGTTEYPLDLTGVRLTALGAGGTRTIDYAYRCREERVTAAREVCAVVPAVETRVSLVPGDGLADGWVREGYAFSPMFTLGLTRKLRNQETFTSWLRLARAG